MNTNEIIQLVGVLYFIFGISLLFNKHYYKDMLFEYMDSKALLFLSGISSFIIGFVIIIHFDVWELSREGFITLLGWIGLLKGISILLFPKFTIRNTKHLFHSNNIELVSLILAFLGVFLMYLGYFS